jgi:hypothetical protein
MRYIAPQIVNTLSATDAVQSFGLPADQKDTTPVIADSSDALPRCTPNAYEADE